MVVFCSINSFALAACQQNFKLLMKHQEVGLFMCNSPKCVYLARSLSGIDRQ